MPRETIIDGPIETSAVTVVPAQPLDALTDFASPLGGIARATQLATALDDIVKKKNLAVSIPGQPKPFLKVEAWLTLGALCGVTASTAETRKDDEGYQATVEVIRLSTGEVVGRAQSRCDWSEQMRGKPRWTEPHAVLSMAQTRATSKALAQVLRWVPTLAGYSGTPLDEMPAEKLVPRPPPVPPEDRKRAPKIEKVLGPPEELGGDLLSVAWLDEPLGFSKEHKDKPWRFFAEGSLESGRISFMRWVTKQEPKDDTQRRNKLRAEQIIIFVEARTEAKARAAESAPPSPAWDSEPPEQPPVPESEYDR